VVGIVLDILGILLIPFLAARASSWADARMISMTQDTMRLSDSIRQISVTIDHGVVVLSTAETTIRGIEASIEDTGSLIDSSASLIGDQAPEIIDDTHDALLVAEEGARAVDQVLRNLAKINFLTGVSYAPEIPLDEAISEVASSLQPLPDDLRQVGDELVQIHSGIEDVGSALTTAGDELKVFTEELGSKNETLSGLADDLEVLSEEIGNAGETTRLVMLAVVVLLELILVGHVMGQAAIFHVGREMASQKTQ
jgi:chromosome segregation ATPase